MNGKILQKLIQESGKTKRWWAKELGISERTLGGLYHEDRIKESYIAIFKKNGLIGNDEKQSGGKSAITEAKDEIIATLIQRIADLEKEHYKLQGKVESLENLLHKQATLKSVHK